MRLASLLALLAGFFALAPAAAEEPVNLDYNDRPPLRMKLPDGSVGGTSGLAATEAFTKAGVPFVWRDIPAARQTAEIEQNIGRACVVGYHRTPERERYALFTRPIDLETPMVAFSGRDSGIPAGLSLDQLLDRSDLLIELKMSKSYGPVLDAHLKAAKARLEWTTLNSAAIIDMIRGGRPIVTFMSLAELDYFLQQNTIAHDAIRIFRFSELSTDQPLHIMCNRNVGAEVIKRLDRAIQELGLPHTNGPGVL